MALEQIKRIEQQGTHISIWTAKVGAGHRVCGVRFRDGFKHVDGGNEEARRQAEVMARELVSTMVADLGGRVSWSEATDE